MFRQIGPTEILLILGVVLLLFGGRKLPELARGSGRALRIFKSEVKELKEDERHDDDVDVVAPDAARREADASLGEKQRRDVAPEQG